MDHPQVEVDHEEELDAGGEEQVDAGGEEQVDAGDEEEVDAGGEEEGALLGVGSEGGAPRRPPRPSRSGKKPRGGKKAPGGGKGERRRNRPGVLALREIRRYQVCYWGEGWIGWWMGDRSISEVH